MTKPFDPTKPVQTRDGRKARIICVDRNHCAPIVALIEGHHEEIMSSFYQDGRYQVTRDSDFDLINTPERTSVWHVAQPDGGYKTKEDALKACYAMYDACPVEIIFEDGKPVDVKLHREDK